MLKIRQALNVSGLAAYFGDAIFSAYDVGSWKPDPGLFLHSAGKMGFPPHQCVVVEDSAVGIQAAVAAGMRPLHFSPSQAPPVCVEAIQFSEMTLLPDLIAAAIA
jgi:beta-phosphoglucomutase-like phosphatase (HAD superfamily)